MENPSLNRLALRDAQADAAQSCIGGGDIGSSHLRLKVGPKYGCSYLKWYAAGFTGVVKFDAAVNLENEGAASIRRTITIVRGCLCQ